MSAKKNLQVTFIVLFLFTSKIFQAQWQPDVRLTNNPTGSFLPFHQMPIATNGNIVHVVWHDSRDARSKVYYKRSTDAGSSWGPDLRLTSNSDSIASNYPSISVSGSNVHVVWRDLRTVNVEIYYKRSTDGGVSWGNDIQLTNDFIQSDHPSISVSGLFVHVVWWDLRDGRSVFYKRSTDGGINWEAERRLTNASSLSQYPFVFVSGTVVHVVWESNRDGNLEIYYKRSADHGTSWGTDTRLTNYPSDSKRPSLSVFASVVHVVWQDHRDGQAQTYYKRSTDEGISWGTDMRLTNSSVYSLTPCIAGSGSVMHVVWQDYSNSMYEIYHKRSTDEGISWGPDTRLTNDSASSFYPYVSVSGTAVNLLWQDERDGNFQIYYKRNPTGNHGGTMNLTAIIEGFYDASSNSMVSDTVTIYLRSANSPYTIVDSSKTLMDSSGNGSFYFSNAINGTNYYIVVRHRNSIETWSSSPGTFSSGTLTYDFTTAASNAYGNNQIQVDNSPIRFAVFSGNTNQDGIIDAGDLSMVDNDAYNSVFGYVQSDVTGNNFVDASDLSIVDNNAYRGVLVRNPIVGEAIYERNGFKEDASNSNIK